MEYIRSLTQQHTESGCFLCHYWNQPDKDSEHFVVCRGEHCFVVMNRFPYTNGHLLISPGEHVGELTALDEVVFSEMNNLLRSCMLMLQQVVNAQGFNIGMNLGRCAGAGLPDHVHNHIVPRWNGDTNFMPVLGDVRVIPDALTPLYHELCKEADALGLNRS
jgi:ATP adenylyltransferase